MREGKHLAAGALGTVSGKVPLEMGISHLECFRTSVLFLGTFKLQRALLHWYFTGRHSWLKHPTASARLQEMDEAWQKQCYSQEICLQSRGCKPCRGATVACYLTLIMQPLRCDLPMLYNI